MNCTRKAVTVSDEVADKATVAILVMTPVTVRVPVALRAAVAASRSVV